MLDRLPRSLALVVLVGVLVAAPTLATGLLLDDVLVRMRMSDAQTAWGEVAWWELYTFARPDLNAQLRAAGFHPWWSDLSVQMRFFRPLSAATHLLDYQLWPDRAALHHLHSLAWYALSIFAAARVFRALGPDAPDAPPFASWVFALAAPHVMTVAWIAARNTLLAFILGCALLLLHVRARERKQLGLHLLAWLVLVLGLLSSEAMLGSLAYLFAWQLCVDAGPRRERLLALLPYAGIALGWRLLYVRAGFGAVASGIYHDPSSDALDFVLALLANLPALLGTRWLLLPVDSWGIMSAGARAGYIALTCVLLGFLARLLWPLLREDPRQRFWALGSLLSLLPFAATMPMDRLVLFAGLGSSAMLAGLAHARPRTSGGLRKLCTAMLVLHLPLSAAFGIVRGATTRAGTQMFAHGVEQAPRDEVVAQQTFVYLSGTFHHVHATTLMRQTTGDPAVPRRSLVLGSMFDAGVLRRIDANTLELRVPEGFMRYKLDRIHRRDASGLAVGERIELPDAEVEILELGADGRPTRVAFRFHQPLEHPSLRWLIVELAPEGLPLEARTRELELPAIGEQLELPGVL